jgi:hypothetical protein
MTRPSMDGVFRVCIMNKFPIIFIIKKIIGLTFILLMFCSTCFADSIPFAILEKYKQIIALIKENNANKLAALIAYPLKRTNPLPDITTQKAFVTYYPIIFDEAFQKKLQNYSDSCVFEHHSAYGLVGGVFDGDMWLNEDGKILVINYLSDKEFHLKNQLTAKIQAQLHPSIREWKENILVGKSKNLTIRVDLTEKSLRYVSWSKGHTMAEKPDLILFNGLQEQQGTMGGTTWTFKRKKWTYVINSHYWKPKNSYFEYMD